MRRLPQHLGRRLMRGELIVPLALGVLIGLVAGVIGFGVPAAAVFGLVRGLQRRLLALIALSHISREVRPGVPRSVGVKYAQTRHSA